MKLLLDTHTLLWMQSRSVRLSSTAREAIATAENELAFSIAGFWEIGIKVSLGKLKLSSAWTEEIPREMGRNGIAWLPIVPAHVAAVADLPWHHRDPFDRLMIAQARHEHMAVVTRDQAFADYGVSVVW